MIVGIVGLGATGRPIARNLMAAGFEVAGFDVAADAMDGFAAMGGLAASSARAVAERSDVVLTLLPGGRALDESVDGEHGLLAATNVAGVLVECSTLALDIKFAHCARLAEHGWTMLDCPLSGTGAQAAAGDLVVLGSGDRVAYERCQGVFRAMSRAQHYLGAFGNGSRMKFVANHLVNVHNVAAAEAMVLGMKAGLDPAVIYEVISDSAGSSRMFQVRARMMADNRYDAVSMALGLWRKDIETIAGFAADLHCPVPLFMAAAQPYYAALAQGLAGQDTAAVCMVLEKVAGVQR